MDSIAIFLSVFGFAFAAWAGVVGWIGKGLLSRLNDARDELRLIRGDLQEEATRLNQYIVQTETRLAVVEDRVFNSKTSDK
jgi:hypothetical protein